MRALVFSGRGDRYHFVIARVEGARNAANTSTLACGVRTFEHDHDRSFAKLLVARQQAEFALIFFKLALVFFAVHAPVVVEIRKHVTPVQRRLRQCGGPAYGRRTASEATL